MAISQIVSDSIAANTVSSSLIANGSILSAHVANGAIGVAHVDVSANGTGAIPVPSGTSAQRPAATTAGYIRYNTTLGSLESANGTAWANVGSGSAASGGVSWTPALQNTSFIAVTGKGYFVNTRNSGIVATLSATPAVGDNITFVDYFQTFSVNNLVLYPNGNKILGNTTNASITLSGQSISLVYSGSDQGWINYSSSIAVGPYTVNYLIVAGGGGGGTDVDVGGGGGGGGLLTGSTTVIPGTTYSISIGGGGAQGTGPDSTGTGGGSNGTQGTNTTGLGQTGIGGGYGGTRPTAGGAGGSGGGGGDGGGAGGAGTSGQGYPGGTTPGMNTNSGQDSGGGGGAGGPAAGVNPGPGAYYSITATTYAAGGRGAQFTTVLGAANSGNGGSGARNGGSGIVVISYPSTQKGLGGTITTSGGYTIHTFTGSGTFTA